MPGIGKTQLALRYAKESFAQQIYSHIFFIEATSITKLQQGLVHLLQLVQPLDSVCAESVQLHLAQRWLEESHSAISWLLIIDNVMLDSVDFLVAHLPRENLSGNILFTPQSRKVAEAVVGIAGAVQLEPLSSDDAVDLLLERARVDYNPESQGVAKGAL